MERDKFVMILFKHSESDHSCFLVILTSNFLNFFFFFLLSFLSFAIEKS